MTTTNDATRAERSDPMLVPTEQPCGDRSEDVISAAMAVCENWHPPPRTTRRIGARHHMATGTVCPTVGTWVAPSALA